MVEKYCYKCGTHLRVGRTVIKSTKGGIRAGFCQSCADTWGQIV